MFFFGEPEDQAKLYWTAAVASLGPAMADSPLDEMSVVDLKIALAYARMAYEAAQKDHAPADTMDVLLEQHDAIFEALVVADDNFRQRVLGNIPGRIIWLGGYSKENIDKYKSLASAS